MPKTASGKVQKARLRQMHAGVTTQLTTFSAQTQCWRGFRRGGREFWNAPRGVPAEALRLLAIQSGWAVASVGLALFVWRRGVRRFEAVGT